MQAYHLILLPNFLCKHKTVATLEPIRGVSLLTCINEGGTTLRRPFWMSFFCQKDEEWRFYEEIFPYVKSYLIKKDRPLLVEGAGLLPHLVKELEWLASSYLCLTPTADFQKKHYRQREWVSYVLEGTTNPEQAFENWMQRDILFAQMVRKEAMRLGYSSLMTDGSQSETQTAEEIARLLKLSNINEIDIKGENT